MTYIIYSISIWISISITFLVAVYIFLRRRKTKYGPLFIFMLFTVIIWTVGTVLETYTNDLESMKFWSRIQYFTYCYLPVLLFVLSVKFTEYKQKVGVKNIIALLVIPTICFVLVWTNDIHGLIRYNEYIDHTGFFPVIAKEYGLGFYVLTIYSYMLMSVALIFFIKAAFIRKTLSVKQALTFILGAGIPLLSSVMYSFKFFPMQYFDITPALIGPSGFIIAFGVFRLELFNIVPIARDKIIENMDSGVLVLDRDGLVVDMNPAFEIITKTTLSEVYCKKARDVFKNISILNKAFLDDYIGSIEHSMPGEKVKMYETTISPLSDKNGINIGGLVVMQEITERKRVEKEYLRQQWILAAHEEREKLARDLHDDLAQVMAFVNMQAQGISKELELAQIDFLSERVNKLIETSQETHSKIRKYIKNIRNTDHMEINFIAELNMVMERFEHQTGIKIKRNIPQWFTDSELHKNAQINAFRIIQEALNNVAKHAKAQNVEITIVKRKGRLSFTVRDDGKGFHINALSKNRRTGFGFAIMSERSVELGGVIDIQSDSKNGTSITLEIPWKREEDDEI